MGSGLEDGLKKKELNKKKGARNGEDLSPSQHKVIPRSMFCGILKY